MANLRVIYDNAADRATTLTASTTAGSMTVANLQNDLKGLAHRSTATSVSYTVTWTNLEKIGGMVLPATNLSNTCTVRVRLYSNTGATALVADSGIKTPLAGLESRATLWPTALNVNSFAFGGYTKIAVWLTSQPLARAAIIDIVDTQNPAGFIDCSRLICGAYWQPSQNFEKGVGLGIVDGSKVSRTEAGSLVADKKPMYEQLRFNYSLLNETDRIKLLSAIKSAGTHKNVLISLYPEDSVDLAQDYMIYGKRKSSDIQMDYYRYYGHSMNIEGW